MLVRIHIYQWIFPKSFLILFIFCLLLRCSFWWWLCQKFWQYIYIFFWNTILLQSPWSGVMPQTVVSSPASAPATVAPSTISATPAVPVGTQAVASQTCNWTEHTSPEGYKYYYNSVTTESRVWFSPLSLSQSINQSINHICISLSLSLSINHSHLHFTCDRWICSGRSPMSWLFSNSNRSCNNSICRNFHFHSFNHSHNHKLS